MLKNIITLLAFLMAGCLYGQKSAYIIYNAKGKKVSYKKMYKQLVKKDMILFGELHNNPIAHWLQYELTADLNADRALILGAEMLEADNQAVLDDYLDDQISYAQLDSLARLWSNYETDYAPLVDFAKENDIAVVATNIPRRYANLVFRGGYEALDTLPAEDKQWIADLPIAFDSELPSYKNILTLLGDHGTPELVKAQAIKDATMAQFILKNYVARHLFVHYNGAYHSDHYEGIVWYLQRARPELTYGTISTVSQDDVHKLLDEHKHVADYIICVDSNMTTTY